MAPEIIRRAIKKASQSICKHSVSAMGFDKKGRFLGSDFNRPRFSRLHGGLHAERNLMSQYGSNLKTIIICRVNNTGEILPIDPCANCLKIAKKLGIKITSVQ